MTHVLIVDDEPLSRSAVTSALEDRGDIESLDSARDAVEALKMLEEKVYDVLLLDIHMPELSGIELTDQLNKRNKRLPSVVFVTAHQEHAIAAFERHAVDYVLKPFSSQRINEALDVAMRRSQNERVAALLGLLPHIQSLLHVPAKVAIKSKGRILFIDPAGISTVEAEGNYVLLQQRSGSYLLRESISVVSEKLAPYGFVRIHRSVLVNRAFVEEIQPWSTGEYILRVRGGKEYTVTRTYKKNMKSLAGFWIGTDAFRPE
jgi:two-component system, LytTR family, response regulator